MATYVNDLRLKEITTGDESGTWGTSTNTNLELIGEAVSYATQESFSSDADVTTTVADGAADPARAFYFKVTSSGSLSATRVLTIAPNTMSRIQIIENATSGSQIITIKQGSGATLNIPNGETRMVYMDGAGSGAAVVDALADINIGGKVTVGVDDTGYDVTLFGATSGQKVFWDESADTLYQTCTVDIDGTVTVGVDDTGYDVKFFGDTSGNYMLWDTSADSLLVNGDIDMVTNGNRIDLDTDNDTSIRASADDTITVEIGGSDLIALTTTSTFSCPLTVGVNDTGHDVNFFGATSGQKVFWDESADTLYQTCTVDIDGTVTVGVDDTGYDVKFFGDTASAYMLWDTSADDLILAGAARVVVPASGLVIGSTAVSSTAAELNLLDGLDRGSILYGNASSVTTVLGQGSADQVLTSDGTDISWEDASGGGITGLTGLVENNSIWLGDDPSGTTDTASYSVALGTTALDAITTGDNNSAIGYGALGSNTTGAGNTAVGKEALFTSTTASNNTAIGLQALYDNTSGTSNVAVGYGCMYNNEDGENNTAVGKSALDANTSGDHNAAVGKDALGAATTASKNSAFGSLAMNANTTGANNTGIGYGALGVNTEADKNVAVGSGAGAALTTGGSNVAIGYNALLVEDTGSQNVAIGLEASKAQNVNSARSVAVGEHTLYSNVSGTGNTAVGQKAGHLTTGNSNTYIGTWAGYQKTSGEQNTTLGYYSMYTGGASSYNVAIGSSAQQGNTTGGYNTSLGHQALETNTTGANNIAIGYRAGRSTATDGNFNILIGSTANLDADGGADQIVIGTDSSVGKGDDTGFINANSGANYAGNNSASWSTTSDRRIKKNIVDSTKGLAEINQIQVRNFEYRLPEEVDEELSPNDAVKKEGVQVGVIAQEVMDILPDIVQTETTGAYSVNPDNITWHLVKAVQELSAEIETLKQQLEE